MSPTKPRKPKPEKPWQRAGAGRHRSADGRFTIDGQAACRWFVTDEKELDELGLERMSGPFATLDAAKATADAMRERPPEVSPLADRIAAAASRPPAPRAPVHQAARSVPTRRAPEPTRRAPEPEPEPPSRTWLDDLEDRRPEAAARASRLIADLEREGIADADALVRRDVVDGEPAIATARLAREIDQVIAMVSAPAAVARLATRVAAGTDPMTAASALARLVAEDVIAALGKVLAAGRLERLPGWELVERTGEPDGARRQVKLDGQDRSSA